jgi:hypothetical protein
MVVPDVAAITAISDGETGARSTTARSTGASLGGWFVDRIADPS